MAVDHRIIRNSENFRGIDKRSSDLKRSMEFATDIKNAAYRISGAINKRKGFKTQITTTNGVYGSATFKKINQTSGAVEDELLIVNNKLQRVIEKDITFINNTEEENIYFSIVSDSGNIRFKMFNAGDSILNASLGTGLNTTDKPLGTLKTDLEGVANSTVIWRKQEDIILLDRVPSSHYIVKVPESLVIAKRYAESINEVGMNIVFGGDLETEFLEIVTAVSYSNGIYEYTIAYDTNSPLEDLNWDVVTNPALHTAQWEDILRGEGASSFPSYTIADNAALDALQASTQKAGLLDQTPFASLPKASESTLIKYKVIEDVDHGDASVTDLFTGYTSGDSASILGSDELENASFAQLNDVMYISNGIDHVMKYDGSKVYRAGLPIFPEDADATDYFDVANIIDDNSSSANIDNNWYAYKLVLEYTDAVGNVITSQPSNFVEKEITSSIDHFHIDFSNYVGSHLDGFDTEGTFDEDHPMYASLNTGTRPDSEAIGKWQDEKRLRVLIYRTKGYTPNTGGEFNDYYLVGDVPFDYDLGGALATPAYSGTTGPAEFPDHTTDADINNLLTLPVIIKRHDPPPKGKYLEVFKDCLIISGQNTNVNNVQFSMGLNTTTGEIGSEYFPDDENAVVVNSSFGDKITSIASLRDLLFIFHKNSIHVLAGDIASPEGAPYTVDLLTKEGGVGCQSHSSVTEFRNQLLFLSETGFYTIDASTALNELSSLIKPFFLDTSLKKKRAVSFNWTEENVLIMILPKENKNSDEHIYTQTNSLVIAYDYYKDAWLQWDNLDFSSGAALFNNKLHIMSRQSSQSTINSMNNSGTTYDYVDHVTPIAFEYDTNWESLADPTIPKKFLRLKVFSQDTDGTFESPSFDIDLKIQMDYLPTDLGNINLDFGALAGGGWGESRWGEFPWGNVPGRAIKTKLPARKGKCMKLRFTNDTENENVLITNYELEIAAPYGTEIKD